MVSIIIVNCILYYYLILLGDNDCLDGSDEDSKMCSKLPCPVNKYRCNNGICISRLRLCDGIDNCGDSSDEFKEICQEIKHSCLTAMNTEHSSQFMCVNNKSCIDISLKCNGLDDCGDGSDEVNCFNQSNASFHLHQCPFGLCSQTCISKTKHHNRLLPLNNNHTNNQTLPYHQNFMCLCSEGYVRLPLLNSFNISSSINQFNSCQANGNQAALLVSSDSGFRVVNPYKNNVQELYNIFSSSIEFNRTYISRIESFDVFYDKEISNIFWTNPHKKSLYRIDVSFVDQLFNFNNEFSYLGHSNQKSRISDPITIMNNLENPRGVAIDWISRYIYVIDSGKASIILSTFDGNFIKTLVSTPILEQPYDLIVDPKNCFLFWTDWSHTSSIKIGRSNLDGSSFRPLVNTDVEWPLGLALDFEADRIYYTDPKTSIIETIRVDGTDRRQIYALHRFQHKPYRIEIWEDYIYVTTLPNHQILKLNKFGSNNKFVSLVQNIPKLNDLVIIQEWKQKKYLSNPCQTSPCPSSNFLCIVRTPQIRICVCPNGFKRILTDKNEVECSNASQTIVHPQNNEKFDCLCLNGGRCRYGPDNASYCECTPLYTGKQCEKFRCTGYCKNHGLCYVDMSNVSSVYSVPESYIGEDHIQIRCMCPFGFEGDKCENRIESCKDHTKYCLNNGTCIFNGDHNTPSIRCNCQPGFFGEQCEICSNLFCKNDGHCLRNNLNISRCNCSPGAFSAFVLNFKFLIDF